MYVLMQDYLWSNHDSSMTIYLWALLYTRYPWSCMIRHELPWVVNMGSGFQVLEICLISWKKVSMLERKLITFTMKNIFQKCWGLPVMPFPVRLNFLEIDIFGNRRIFVIPKMGIEVFGQKIFVGVLKFILVSPDSYTYNKHLTVVTME